MNRIPFLETPSFKDLFEIAKNFYVQVDYSVRGNYVIIPELTGNGKINYKNLNS